jgi:hypothetical protein
VEGKDPVQVIRGKISFVKDYFVVDMVFVASAQVIDTDDLVLGFVRQNPLGHSGSNQSRNAGDQNCFHQV